MCKRKRILAGLLCLLLCCMPAMAEVTTDVGGFADAGGQIVEPGMDPEGGFVTDDTQFYTEDSTGLGTDTYAPATDIKDADLRIGYVSGTMAQMNPLFCNERDLVSMNQLVFESLVELDENYKPVPLLADNWEHQDTSWVFTLRSGITFHNGAELTAYDVQNSYDAFVAQDRNPYSSRLKLLVEDLKAIDEYTVAVQAKYSGYMTLYAMTFPVLHSMTLNDEFPRGTGPYWYVRYELDHAVRIEANPLWWKQAPTLQSVTFCYYPEISQALEALQTGQIDMLSTRSPTAALNRKLSNVTSMDYGTSTYEMLLPNLSSSSVMSDVRMRKAVMYAIDRAVLASNAYLDMAIQSEVPVLPGSWLYESQSAKYYCSPERALQLLYECGWKDLTGDTMLNKLDGIRVEELKVDIITYNDSTSSVREKAAQAIAGNLNAVGIATTVSVLSGGDMADRLESGDYDLALVGVNLSEVPVLQPLLHSDGSLNMNGHSNEEIDTLIAKSAMADDEASLKQIYSQLQLLVVEQLPIMGLLFRTGTVLSTRSMGGMSGIRELEAFRGLEYLME